MKKEMSHLITDFFSTYLSNEAGLSDNTVKSYRDSFLLFFSYLEVEKICSMKKLDASVFTADIIINFLDWLENKRKCGISTRNQRLAALKAFSNYAIRSCPESCKKFQDILRIKIKKAPQTNVDYLSVDAITLLMSKPDAGTKEGIRDLAILSLLYESGCRVQELIDFRYDDATFRAPNTIKVIGKGKKSRIIPIGQKVADIVRKYADCYEITSTDKILFTNRYKQPLSRSGISYILNKYATAARSDAPDLYEKKIHPHVLRHSKAMHLLENEVNLIYIRDFLGHSSVTTTEIYARCNPELKRKYIEQSALVIEDAIIPYSANEKEDLISWLRNNL